MKKAILTLTLGSGLALLSPSCKVDPKDPNFIAWKKERNKKASQDSAVQREVKRHEQKSNLENEIEYLQEKLSRVPQIKGIDSSQKAEREIYYTNQLKKDSLALKRF